MGEKKENFEKLLHRLEEIVETMERGEITLDESLKLYEEGMEKSRKLTEILTAARARVQKLVRDEDEHLRMEDFTGQEYEENDQ